MVMSVVDILLVMLRLARLPPTWGLAFHLVTTYDVFF